MSCIPDSETTEAMYSVYIDGFSLSQVGKRYGVSRQTVYMRFKRAGKPMRSTNRKEAICFNGNTYTERANGYLARTDGNREYLHRDIWKHFNGEIPKGYDIHHIDEDRHNNKIDNLVLVAKDQHTRLHGFKNNQYTRQRGSTCHVA